MSALDPAAPLAAPRPSRVQRVRDSLTGLGPHRLLLLVGAVLIVGFISMSVLFPPDRAFAPLAEASLVLQDRNGVPIARRGQRKDAPVDVTALPPHVAQAFLAIEDRRFYQHMGIDPRGVARAAAHNARAGAIQQGGSTITQQLAKVAYLNSERTFRRKIGESLVAMWLELRLSKDAILSRYLSAVYFGDGMHGLRAASLHYFDTPPEQLDVAQAAVLAGLVKAPSNLAPTRHPQAARDRVRVVLTAMVDAGVLAETDAGAVDMPRIAAPRDRLPVGTHFADWVSADAKLGVRPGYGMQPLRTTLDSKLQAASERAVERVLGRSGEAAVIAMRPDGQVLAMVGGRDYGASQFNRATQAERQPGSAFKLFVYLAALRDGATPDTRVDDTPLQIGDWRPANHDGRYAGSITLREAFARSSNVAAVRLAQDVGPRAVVRVARELGIDRDFDAEPMIALGSQEVTLLELTSAYAAVAAGAYPVRAHGIPRAAVDEDVEQMDPRERAAMLDLMWSAVEHGTARNARLQTPAFGKTGTSQDSRDAIFVGMAGDMVVGVWVGHDDNRPMRGVNGGDEPARIWREVMAAAGYPARRELRVRKEAQPRTRRGKGSNLRSLLRRLG